MKKPQWIFIGITALFLCVVLGVFIGRRTAGVYIPLDEQITAGSENRNPPDDVGKIDLNTATLQQLLLIPGIGPTLAQRILDYRDTVGRFEDIQQITEVKGIGEKTFEAMKDYIKVEAANENSGS